MQCDLVECDAFDILPQTIEPNFDSQVHFWDTVDQEVDKMDQLQLLYGPIMIQPLLQSRWYLLHRDK